MGFFFSGDEKYRDLSCDDAYRTYLITRSEPPIVHHAGGMQLKRLRVHMRSAMSRIDGFLKSLLEAIVAGKIHRLSRDLEAHRTRPDDQPERGTLAAGAARRTGLER